MSMSFIIQGPDGSICYARTMTDDRICQARSQPERMKELPTLILTANMNMADCGSDNPGQCRILNGSA